MTKKLPIVIRRNILFLLILLFLFTRLYNLTVLPIFTDESIYIYWAKYIATYHSNWFMSLADGKPPLFIWIVSVFLKIFPSSMYLFAGRFVSVLAGGIVLVGVYKLSLFLFKSRKTGIIAVFLCVINPFILFYDRIALFESFLSASLIWSVYYAFRTSISYTKRHAFLWGLFLGLALLIKPPAVIFLLLTPICFFLLIPKKDIRKSIKKIFLLPAFAILIAETVHSIQKLSVNYRLVDVKNQQFQLPLSQLFSDPFILLSRNAKELFDWIITYYTIPVFLLGSLGLVVLLCKDLRRGLILLLLWIAPIVAFAVVGKIIFPRYILFTTPYFLIGLAGVFGMFLNHAYVRSFQKVVLILTILLSLRFDFYILTNPVVAPFPTADRDQYITSEHSGYGLDTIFSFLDKELAQGPQIMLVTQGKFGLFPYAFRLNYWDDKRIMFYQAWLTEKLDVDAYALQDSAKVYIVLKQNEAIPKNFPFREVLRGEKPGREHPIILATPIEKKI